MKFANRLFTASLVASLWITFLGLRPWSEMWVAVVVFAVGMSVTGIWSMGVQVVELVEDDIP